MSEYKTTGRQQGKTQAHIEDLTRRLNQKAKRIAELEEELDEVREAWIFARNSCQRAEVHAASMRAALEECLGAMTGGLDGKWSENADPAGMARAALATDAGAKVLAVVEAARAWTNAGSFIKEQYAEVSLFNAVSALDGTDS